MQISAINPADDSPGPTNPPLKIAGIAISLNGMGSQASYLAGNAISLGGIASRGRFHALDVPLVMRGGAVSCGCFQDRPPMLQFCATSAVPFTVSR